MHEKTDKVADIQQAVQAFLADVGINMYDEND